MQDDYKDIIASLEKAGSGVAKVRVPRAARFSMLFYPYKCTMHNEMGERILIGNGSFSVTKRWEYYGDTKEPGIIAGNYIDASKNCHILTGGEHHNERVFNIATQYARPYWPESVTPACYSRGATRIGHGVTLSHGVVIRSGVTIGNGAVIGAGAVVLDDVPDFAIAVGNPARVLKYRFTPEQIEKINAAQWWELKPSQLYQHMETINRAHETPATFPKEHCITRQERMVIRFNKRDSAQFIAEFLGIEKDGQFIPKNQMPRLLQFYQSQLHLPDDAAAYVLDDIFSQL